jgi:peptidoglycan/LPS O-acetylase OafA/YrhL
MTLDTIFQANDRRGPSFDMLRLFAALLVMASHSFLITGTPNVIWSHVTRQISSGALAVAVFFVLSGYVVTESLKRDSDPLRFLRRRALRVFPALAVLVAVTVFIYGPLMTALPVAEYFRRPETFVYLISMVFPMKESLPGVFEHAPAYFVNGSLWTLRYELICYVALAAAGAFLLSHRRWGVAAAVLATLASGILALLNIHLTHGLLFQVTRGLPLVACFGAGVVVSLYASVIPVTRAWIVAAAVAVVLSLKFGGFALVFPFAGAYLVAIIGNSRLLEFASFRRGIWAGDFSYGTYIIAFPVQQAINAVMGSASNAWNNLLVSVPATLALAMLSWHLIEKLCLKLKYARPALIPGTV